MPPAVEQTFRAYGPSHLAALLATVLVAAVMIWVARRGLGRTQRAWSGSWPRPWWCSGR
ncbi:hypothetical protein [Verrucomicrobium spinosum]|uniref:hypothetical protein n=1 Tax=Verrucomicrobium spinosum TaxID=2736 RepID=UPI0012E1D2CF|nr:hypothetical protein [Verrucomicrobium spinosum]